jgi:hypothetical protein
MHSPASVRRNVGNGDVGIQEEHPRTAREPAAAIDRGSEPKVAIEVPNGHAAKACDSRCKSMSRRAVVDDLHGGQSGPHGRGAVELPHEPRGVLPLAEVDDDDGQLDRRRRGGSSRAERREREFVAGFGHGRVRRGAVWRVSQGHAGSFPVPAAGPPAVAR